MRLPVTRGRAILRFGLGLGLSLFAMTAATVLAPSSSSAVGEHVTLPVLLEGLSCPSVSHCVTVGVDATGASVIYVTSNGATSWTPETVPVNTPYLRQVSCATSSECIARGTGGESEPSSEPFPVFTETSDGGSAWTTQPVDQTLLDSTGGEVACASPPNCYMMSSPGVLRSTNQGVSWSAVPGGQWQPSAPNWYAGPDDMTCVRATSFCAIVGTDASGAFEFRATRGDAHVVELAVLKHVGGDPGDFSVSCASPRSCMVVSDLRAKALLTSDGGVRWAIRSLPKEVTEVDSISCPTASECIALVIGSRHPGFLLAATTRDGGIGWSLSAISPDPKSYIASIICPSSSRCYVAGPATPHGSVYMRVAIDGQWRRTNV